MKLSFSTSGWYDFSFQEFCAMAVDLGFDGIEIKLSEQGFFARGERPFSVDKLAQTARRLRDMRLETPCLSTACCLSEPDEEDARLAEARECIAIAAGLGAPYVRLRADSREGRGDDELACARLAPLLEKAEGAGVTLLIETCGPYADTKRLGLLLGRFASDNLAALWDVHHPYRYFDESPEQTVQNLGAYIKHVHVKDSHKAQGKLEYRLMGEGSLPVEDMINALRSINYEGYLSFEWMGSWSEEMNDAGIVFPHFINYMSRYTSQGQPSQLYSNKAGTGRYVWKKDALIDRTFSQVLDRLAQEFPDQYAFRFTTLDYTRTYSEFREDVDNFCRSLIALGVKAGDHVAVWAPNVPQWYVAFWAVTKLGAVLVSVNTAYKIHEAEYLLRQSDTHTLIMADGYRDSNYVEIMRELCPELGAKGSPLRSRRLPFLRNIITLQSKQKGCLTWEEALARGGQTPLEEVYRRAALVDCNDVCNMQYTSGTTGFPKGVMLTHRNIVNNGKCIGDRMDLSTADRMMVQVPMFHCFGMVLAMTAAMTHGVTLSPLPYFSPKPALACVNQERITCFHGVPTMFIAMLEHEDFPKTDFSSMRTGIMAGSPCPAPVMRDVLSKMRMSEVTIVYGQTEASPGCTMSSADDPVEVRVGTVGRPLPEIECRVVDPDTGLEVPDGVNGEFVARGYNIMKGYYKMPQATAAAIDKEGWLHTGDLACRTAQGNFCITGRLKDMIIRGGENIYPKEIEEFIYTHPKVADVQVIGVPDDRLGEQIAAWVILKEGQSLTAQEIKAYVSEHMAKHKTPKYVKFVAEFPMNAAGKILKYKMRQVSSEEL